MIRYNAEELFQMAESVERDGAAFYREAAQATNNQDLVDLLTQLADWEDRHRQRFAAMRNELPPEAQHEAGPGDPVEEHAADYLQAFVDGKVFPDPTRAERSSYPNLEVPEDVLDYALGREKDTIVFFLTVQGQVPKFWGHDRIRAIIDEELKHVHILEQKRRELHVAQSPEADGSPDKTSHGETPTS